MSDNIQTTQTIKMLEKIGVLVKFRQNSDNFKTNIQTKFRQNQTTILTELRQVLTKIR